jgi:hypothetical protein
MIPGGMKMKRTHKEGTMSAALAVAVIAIIAGSVAAGYCVGMFDLTGGGGHAADVTDDTDPPTDDTVTGSVLRYTVMPVENDNRVEYYYAADGYSVYYIYLGKVDNVPIAYEVTQKYDGIPIELSYTTSYTTEEHVSISSQFCVAYTVGSTVSSKNSVHNSVTMGFDAGDPFNIARIRGSVEKGWGKEWENIYSDSRSVSKTDTYTSFTKWAKTVSSTYHVTVGGHGEDAGYYRYTLFATCDAFATVVVDNNSNECYYEYAMMARTGSYFMSLDYSSDNEFAGEDGMLKLKLTDHALESLPAVPEASDQRTYDISGMTGTDAGTITVPVDVNRIKIIGDPSKIMTMNIVIGPRHADLKITLINVKFIAPDGKAAIKDESTTASPHTVIVEIVGDNMIAGGVGTKAVTNGAAGIDVGTRHSVSVTGKGDLAVIGGAGRNGDAWSGTNGGNGGYGIYCRAVSFASASGNIAVTGGNGGNGGSGANSSSLFSKGGSGGNGGNGGYAIASVEKPTDTSYLPMVLTGGSGGNGGSGGSGGWGGSNGSAGANGIGRGMHLWFDINKQKEMPL